MQPVELAFLATLPLGHCDIDSHGAGGVWLPLGTKKLGSWPGLVAGRGSKGQKPQTRPCFSTDGAGARSGKAELSGGRLQGSKPGRLGPGTAPLSTSGGAQRGRLGRDGGEGSHLGHTRWAWALFPGNGWGRKSCLPSDGNLLSRPAGGAEPPGTQQLPPRRAGGRRGLPLPSAALPPSGTSRTLITASACPNDSERA